MRKVPRWIAWRSMIQNHSYARFMNYAEVGVKFVAIQGLSANRPRTSHFL